MSFSLLRLASAGALSLAVAGMAHAEDLPSYAITLKDHKYTPSEIHVASGKPFYVVVTNASDAADEFEMLFPPLEQGLQAGETRKVLVRPLKVGRFPYMGENDPDGERGAFISQ
jgi:hypothetical protein